MVVIVKKKPFEKLKDESEKPEQHWDNPMNPEKAGDERDIEQLKRQKKEAERRKDNLSDNNETTK